MTTIRVAKRRRFTVISRDAVNDDRLSFRARGVLAWLLDKPDDWSCNSEQIASAGREGRDAVRVALRELQAAGYLRHEKVQGETGRWRTATMLFEVPTPENPSSVPTPENPTVGKPGPVVPSTVTKDCNTRDLDASFDAWYATYPVKKAKGAALRAYRAALKLASAEDLLLALKRQVPEIETRRDAGYALHPASWLNARRWEDELPEEPKLRIQNGAVMSEFYQ